MSPAYRLIAKDSAGVVHVGLDIVDTSVLDSFVVEVFAPKNLNSC